MADKVIQVVVTGRVQGVSYRAWTQRTAEALGLSGWVRNREDGTVEAVLQGPAARVDEMLARMRQGPRFARVSDVTVSDAAAEGGGDGFQIRR